MKNALKAQEVVNTIQHSRIERAGGEVTVPVRFDTEREFSAISAWFQGQSALKLLRVGPDL